MVNSDFSQRVVVHGQQLPWQPSPIKGVERRMLDRVGDEVARATSIVRYAPSSKFSAHTHGAGEEFIVLKGVFQDEHGDYPVGSYVRNPPQSSHIPGSKDGCVIFVKLRQFANSDRTEIRVQISDIPTAAAKNRPGVEIKPLFQNKREEVRVEQWQPNAKVTFDAPGGAEILVLAGSFITGDDELIAQSWLRMPINSKIAAQAGAEGAIVWLKTGHLLFI